MKDDPDWKGPTKQSEEWSRCKLSIESCCLTGEVLQARCWRLNWLALDFLLLGDPPHSVELFVHCLGSTFGATSRLELGGIA